MDTADHLNQILSRLRIAEIACHEPARLSIAYAGCDHVVTSEVDQAGGCIDIFARFTAAPGVDQAELRLDGDPIRWLRVDPEVPEGAVLRLQVSIILPGIPVSS